MNDIAPAQEYIAIQRVQGLGVTSFMKLARPHSLQELLESGGSCLQLDREWLLNHNFDRDMVKSHCATSPVSAVETGKYGVVLIKTRNSVFQAIPKFI